MLSETTLWFLLGLALLAPPLGAILLRLLQPRIGSVGVGLGAAGLLTIAAVALLTISRNPLPPLRIGDLTLLPAWEPPIAAVTEPELAPVPVFPTLSPLPAVPTLTPRPTTTPMPTITPTLEPTAIPEPTATPTLEPTATPEPTVTPEPTAAGPRRYTVQAGDTLRAIADRFGVTIEAILQANNLTPAQGDNLRVGQELVIP
ncbi:LysM peptidoglycan-binding domain-containing protein [Chloroflexus sp.]|uniref:LysM peptidoglycan-binding domain-containing protein n=1 Tax=Chloroflexus sp. TaxID=1904827 RepID=UPI0026386D3D|nr:LysM peptidoglycan-binding domain-containing protein [uncultured Chloroflexus sp.]